MPGEVLPNLNPTWNGLHSLVNAQLITSPAEYPTAEVAEAVLCVVRGFDNETLEEARYIGHRLLMPGFASELDDAENRQNIITSMSDSLSEYWSLMGSRTTRGLFIPDNNRQSRFYMHQPFQDVALRASQALPPSLRLIADTLTVEADTRKGVKYNNPIDIIIAEHLTSRQVGAEALSGAGIVLTSVFSKIHIFKNATGSGAEATTSSSIGDVTSARIADVIPDAMGQIEQLKLLGRRCAGMRLDRFLNFIHDCVVLDDHGLAHFAKLKETPEAATSQSLNEGHPVLHMKTLTCPALSVRELIPTVIEMLVQTLSQAADKIDNRVHEYIIREWGQE